MLGNAITSALFIIGWALFWKFVIDVVWNAFGSQIIEGLWELEDSYDRLQDR
jgi:hypothetical protein